MATSAESDAKGLSETEKMDKVAKQLQRKLEEGNKNSGVEVSELSPRHRDSEQMCGAH